MAVPCAHHVVVLADALAAGRMTAGVFLDWSMLPAHACSRALVFTSLKDPPLTSHVFTQIQFVDHFSGCQLCTQQSKDKGAYRECEAEFLRSYEFASGALRELEPPPAPRNATHFKQLAATPYCLVRAVPQ